MEKDPTAFYTVEEFDIAIETFGTFCQLRSESVRGQLTGTIPATSLEQQKDTSILINADNINLSSMGVMSHDSQNGAPPTGGHRKGRRPDDRNELSDDSSRLD